MTSSIEKLEKAKTILEKNLSPYIENVFYEPRLARIRIKLRDELLIFIQYNDFNEYSYSLIFSNIHLDRCRFDNYDDKWNVSTKPHHYHPRLLKIGIESSMKGVPKYDLR